MHFVVLSFSCSAFFIGEVFDYSSFIAAALTSVVQHAYGHYVLGCVILESGMPTLPDGKHETLCVSKP